MNKVILMGRLTRDPEIRYSQGETPMCIARYTLAVDRRFGKGGNNNDGNSADFISCVAFGKSGEFAEKYLRKGTKMAVTGRIQTGSYTNRDGVKVYTTEVVIEEQEFAESKASQGQAAPMGGQMGAPAQQHAGGGQQGMPAPQYAGNAQQGMPVQNQYQNTAPNNGAYQQQSFVNNNQQRGGGPAQGGYNGYNSQLDGFMNIPDGIEEELPFS